MIFRLRHRLMTHSGILLLGLFVVAFSTSPARAHEIHHAGHHADHRSEAAGNEEVREMLQRFRETGDDAHLDRAWSMIESAMSEGVRDPDLLVNAAMIAQARHRFDEALQLARSAVELRPDEDQAWLLIAAVHLVRGESGPAGQACSRLTRAPWLVIVGCHARVSHARGESAAVRGRVEQLIGAIERSQVDDAQFAWFLSIAGDLAVASGDADTAAVRFEQSLAIEENTQVRAALVDVLIEADRLDAAAEVLAQGSTALPLEVRRMIVARRTGESQETRIADADQTFQDWIAAADWLHAREMARFYTDVLVRPELALRLALINVETQREPEDLRLVHRTSRASDHRHAY